MAVIKHIKIRNSNYDAATDYLCFKHDEFTNKPILNEDGQMIPRDEYLLDGINCDPFNFGRECESTNAYFKKNNTRSEVKAHHYIISFDPRDKDENGLTPDRAQELGKEFAAKNFPGHQTIICTHPDGHNSAGSPAMGMMTEFDRFCIMLKIPPFHACGVCATSAAMVPVLSFTSVNMVVRLLDTKLVRSSLMASSIFSNKSNNRYFLLTF